MYFSPTIGGINLFDRWHVIPTTKISLSPAPVKTNTVEIPGVNGVYDYTSFFGGPTYGMREGEWEFTILNDVNPLTGWYFPKNTVKSPDTVYKEMLSEIHGKQLSLRLEDDSTEYNGRFTINDFKHNKDYASITISYSVNP